MTANERIDRIFDRAARYAIAEWNRPFGEVEEIKQTLWVWYMESPATQRKLLDLPNHEATNIAKRAAVQKLSKRQNEDNSWSGANHYDAENVKAALKGEIFNPYLAEILPQAFKALEEQNAGYAAAIRSRYVDKVIPKGSASDKLLHAHRAITEHVNRIAITAEMSTDSDGNLNVKEGPGSRTVLQKKRVEKTGERPEARRVKGDHSDPTARMALLLLENPEQDGISLRDEYLHETSLQDFLEGKGGA